MADRPTFEHEGQPVRACGILLWTRKNNQIHRLFRKIKNKYEDIGGKTDVKDINAKETAIRETVEETDGKLFSETHTRDQCAVILRELVDKVSPQDIEYNKISKYLLYRIEVEPDILDLSMKRFGLSEETDWGTLEHYYQWRWELPYHNQLHYRLRGLRL